MDAIRSDNEKLHARNTDLLESSSQYEQQQVQLDNAKRQIANLESDLANLSEWKKITDVTFMDYFLLRSFFDHFVFFLFTS